jgi:hypothetical protein
MINKTILNNFLSIINEQQLSGDTIDKEFTDEYGYNWGGYYRGKKFPPNYSIQNFGIEVDNIDEMIIGQSYNIYLEDFDHWFMGYDFTADKIGLYNFVLDIQNETDPIDKRKLTNIIKKGYIVNHVA